MQQTTQIELARRLFNLYDAKSTDLAEEEYRQATHEYHDPAVAQHELNTLFRKLPLLLCLSTELPNPGDYIVDDFSGIPIIAVRTTDGKVAAYLNICRHRGARLECARGTSLDALRCPYHAWTYQLEDGRLTSIPFAAGFEGLDQSALGLTPLPVHEAQGLVFVCPTQGLTADFDAYLKPCQEDLENYGLEKYHHFETRVLEAEINWKLVVDTFLETYHLSTLHRTTIAPLLHSNLSTFTALGPHLRMVAARKTLDTLRDQPTRDWDLITHSAIVYVLFPNTVFIMQGDHLETWRVYPGLTPGESKMHVSLYTPEPTVTESARKHWTNNMNLLMATVREEDFPLATNMQSDFPVGHDALIFGRNEPALQHYHKTLNTFFPEQV